MADLTDIRSYDPARDLAAVQRIWTEVGWVESDDERAAIGLFLEAGHAEVALLDGDAECMVHRSPGVIRYQDVDLPLCAITAVTTSRVARRLGLATSMTARALAAGAESGASVAALGMFEQGFYDRFGFGTAPPQVFVSFDPTRLRVDAPYRRPHRLGADDTREMHDALRRRRRRHGGVALDGPGLYAGEFAFLSQPFALGYRSDGELTHFVAGSAKGEHGPYEVGMIAYRSTDQLLELLRLLHELGDQVATVTMPEPPDIQFQDLLELPVRSRVERKRSEHETGFRAVPWWQLRLLDVTSSVRARSWPGPSVDFNLRLRDPLAELDASPWQGIGGDYTVHVAEESEAEAGHRPGLPVVDASVGAFSRCWFGVRPASSLAVTDDLVAPPDLLAALDVALAVGRPDPGLMF